MKDISRPVSSSSTAPRKSGIEFHSLSKTFNMTGWRIGFAVGNKKAIGGLGKIKTNIDSGAFQAVQVAGIEALKNYKIGLEDRNKDIPGAKGYFLQGSRRGRFKLQ